MNKPPESRSNLPKAVAFFKQPVWSRLFDALYHKYITQGRIGGQVVLRDCTVEEQREIARFLKKKLPLQGDVTVRLSDFQKALDESGFACDLPSLLLALFPERSHTTRPEQRERRAISQQRFYDTLSALIEGLPNDSRGQHWLLHGAHGRDELFRRYKNESPETQEQLVRHAQTIAHALNQLPTPPVFERLSIFAQRISGDPHYFDGNTSTGRIFFHALMDLARQEPSMPHAEPQIVHDEPTNNSAVVESSEQYHHRLLLYYEAGLLLDTISSTVAVFHLTYAEDHAGLADALVQHAGERILTLSLRQLLAWKKLCSTSKDIYLFENPQVFEVVVDELQHIAGSMTEDKKPTLPTLICTSGWPSMAVICLLNLLIESVPDLSLHYSGDFDLQGLRIASHLLTRYQEGCFLWRFDPSSYLTALHSKAAELSASEISGLQALPEIFAPLIAVMREQNKKAYQEGITQLLLQDIEKTFHRG
ncbi:MAG TPA: TIGR02679 domain-containing protein [Ktedonobacteraceae bacterium]|nr:TIGR02679 domain-containing protein [Ktedonobacteraceae bacterium]